MNVDQNRAIKRQDEDELDAFKSCLPVFLWKTVTILKIENRFLIFQGCHCFGGHPEGEET